MVLPIFNLKVDLMEYHSQNIGYLMCNVKLSRVFGMHLCPALKSGS